MKLKIGLLLGAMMMACSHVWAGDLIVKIKEKESIASISNENVTATKLLVKDLNLYLVSYRSFVNIEAKLEELNQHPVVEYAQHNDVLKKRGLPQDPYFPQQWSLDDQVAGGIQARQAWQISTGGVDREGRQVVVAIIDGGFDISHEDIAPNAWVNRQEIPNNGKDDDGNGYIDDIHGWNAAQHTGDINVEEHGTLVASIIGARSDNGIGVAGMNWNSNLMFVTVEQLTTAEVAEGYGYVMAQKKLWISSHGQKGANVVVTNMSMGIDGKKCTSQGYPVWNDLYNSMGKLGILSAVAVPNENWDVDKVGDVPSTCSSDYIIAVTNSDRDGHYSSEVDPFTGKREPIAARGIKSVDLAAPGTDIWGAVPFVCEEEMSSCDKKKKYVAWTGTSFASPHVAGSVALMMSAASQKFLEEYDAHPDQAALTLKSLLLTTVDPSQEFSTLVLSGGRLNLLGAMQAAESY